MSAQADVVVPKLSFLSGNSQLDSRFSQASMLVALVRGETVGWPSFKARLSPVADEETKDKCEQAND